MLIAILKMKVDNYVCVESEKNECELLMLYGIAVRLTVFFILCFCSATQVFCMLNVLQLRVFIFNTLVNSILRQGFMSTNINYEVIER